MGSVASYAQSLQKYVLSRRQQWLTLSNLGLSQGLVFVIGLASSSLMARWFPVEIYGQYQVIVSLMTLVGSFCLKGLHQSMTISAAKQYDGNVSRILGLKFGANLIGAFVVAGIGFYYTMTGQPVLGVGVFIAAIFFPFRLQLIWRGWLDGRGEINKAAFSKVIMVALALFGVLVVVLSGSVTLNKVSLWLFGLPAVLTAVLLIYIWRSRQNNVTHTPTIKYGLHTTVATMLAGLIAADKLILNEYLSPSDVAIYSIALIFPAQLNKVFDMFNQFITPKIYKAESIASTWQYFRKKFVLLVALFIGMGIVGFVALPILVPLLFSDKYVSAVPDAKWLWLSLSIFMPPAYLANILRAQKKVKFVYLTSIGSPLARFLLYFLLLPLGVTGIVLATIIIYVVNGIVYSTSFAYYLYLDRN